MGAIQCWILSVCTDFPCVRRRNRISLSMGSRIERSWIDSIHRNPFFHNHFVSWFVVCMEERCVEMGVVTVVKNQE